jgi:hypothetical protein
MNNPTIDDVRDLAQAGHREGNDTPEETLNRLWRKHIDGRVKKYGGEFVTAAPRCLTAENTSITSEKWPTDALSKLFPEDSERPLQGPETAPVIIVRFRKQDCLIDGGRRITKWRRENDTNLHDAFVVSLNK